MPSALVKGQCAPFTCLTCHSGLSIRTRARFEVRVRTSNIAGFQIRFPLDVWSKIWPDFWLEIRQDFWPESPAGNPGGFLAKVRQEMPRPDFQLEIWPDFWPHFQSEIRDPAGNPAGNLAKSSWISGRISSRFEPEKQVRSSSSNRGTLETAMKWFQVILNDSRCNQVRPLSQSESPSSPFPFPNPPIKGV